MAFSQEPMRQLGSYIMDVVVFILLYLWLYTEPRWFHHLKNRTPSHKGVLLAKLDSILNIGTRGVCSNPEYQKMIERLDRFP